MDVTLYLTSGGRLRRVTVQNGTGSIGRYLSGVGLAAAPPEVAAARPPRVRNSPLYVEQIRGVTTQLFEPKTNPNRFLERIDAPGVEH